MKIGSIDLKIIPDSRGEDTLEVVMGSGEVEVTASVPSGKSKGKDEVFVLEPQKALEKFESLKPQLLEKDFLTLEDFDNFLISLDGTPNKQNLGGNLILVLSIGFTKLMAQAEGVEVYESIAKISGGEKSLPLCFFNLIEGGVHAKQSLPFQEYLYVPKTSSPKKSLEDVTAVIKNLGELIHQKYGHLKQGDEGGYTIPSDDPLTGLEVLYKASTCDTTKGGPGDCYLSLDVAASALCLDGVYQIGGKVAGRGQLMDVYRKGLSNFNLLSIEDPFDEEDFEGFELITSEMGDKIWIVGDDLTATNPEKIKVAKEKKAINAVIIKPNQIGSITETIKAANLAKSYGWKIIVSHRSGETKDTFIADLAVGLGADGLKSGCPLQEERLVKYQRLIEIEKTWHI